jgi:acetylornithine deacetylase/succinyl-diaminopimelate desuccinylase-like protein
MSRDKAIANAASSIGLGDFQRQLARRVAFATESQNAERKPVLTEYLQAELAPAFQSIGFRCRIREHEGWPFLLATRIEDPTLPTMLSYGHGDVVYGMQGGWDDGLSPWDMRERSGRWYGRGVADNKGQHTINMMALAAVLETRGRLGFNAKFLFEMGEEVASPGLHGFVAAHGDELAADVLIASDGPRLSAGRPTLFLGSRGAVSFDIWIDARKGGHHSGNWGGLLSDPATQLAHAIATISGPTGQIQVPEWLPGDIPESVRRALADCAIDPQPGDPRIDPEWGQPGLSAAEKLCAWSSFCVLAFEAGNPRAPVGAIPARAWARCQLRTVVGVDEDDVIPALRRHLDARGFGYVGVAATAGDALFRATRLDPGNPWVSWCAASIERTTRGKPAILPSFGGGLPNDAFAETLGLPTLWVPHSYPACAQHAPNEHLPIAVAKEGLAIMAGLFWDLGEVGSQGPMIAHP